MYCRIALALGVATSLWAGEWSAPVDATARDGKPLVTCRARLAGEFLLVEVVRDGMSMPWTTNNAQRKRFRGRLRSVSNRTLSR